MTDSDLMCVWLHSKDSVEEANSSAAVSHSEDDSGNENSQNGVVRIFPVVSNWTGILQRSSD